MVFTLRTLAARIVALKAEAYQLHKQLRTLLTAHPQAAAAPRGRPGQRRSAAHRRR
ncbi:hypothetical protein [Pseudonocardia adelaidensis]|uniref:Uncharacterized protein n=1 Tax=Pseudonocardia adelaidensis TaxID=648754 RepID=A0ABP9NPS2_9PSEU